MNGGISPDRFTIAGRGEYEPLFPNDTAQHQGLNARVEIVILYPVDTNVIETNITPQTTAP